MAQSYATFPYLENKISDFLVSKKKVNKIIKSIKQFHFSHRCEIKIVQIFKLNRGMFIIYRDGSAFNYHFLLWNYGLSISSFLMFTKHCSELLFND